MATDISSTSCSRRFELCLPKFLILVFDSFLKSEVFEVIRISCIPSETFLLLLMIYGKKVMMSSSRDTFSKSTWDSSVFKVQNSITSWINVASLNKVRTVSKNFCIERLLNLFWPYFMYDGCLGTTCFFKLVNFLLSIPFCLTCLEMVFICLNISGSSESMLLKNWSKVKKGN